MKYGYEEVECRIRGETGTTVILTISRNWKTIDFVIERVPEY